MKNFVVYTAARLGLFAVVWGLIWLVFGVLGGWIEWTSVSAMYTALIAMLFSSIIALTLLRGLRDRLAIDVQTRADKAKAAFDARRGAEDADGAADQPSETSSNPTKKPPE